MQNQQAAFLVQLVNSTLLLNGTAVSIPAATYTTANQYRIVYLGGGYILLASYCSRSACAGYGCYGNGSCIACGYSYPARNASTGCSCPQNYYDDGFNAQCSPLLNLSVLQQSGSVLQSIALLVCTTPRQGAFHPALNTLFLLACVNDGLLRFYDTSLDTFDLSASF